MKTHALVIARLAAFAFAAAAHADPVPIVNHSFEDPVLVDGGFVQQSPGWTRTNTFCGVFNPSVTAFPSQAPDGQNVAFLDGSSQLSQITGAILSPNTTYTLSVDYGSRLDFAGIAPFIALRVNGLIIAGSNPFASPAPPGTFQTLTIAVGTGDTHHALGRTIEVVLGVTGPGIQVDYDNVRLDATPDFFAPSCATPRQYLDPLPQDPVQIGAAVTDDTAVLYSTPEQALHFFARQGNLWTPTQSLEAPTINVAGNATPMAIEGDTLVVGADGESAGATASGAAHVFRRTAGAWAFDELLTAAAPEFNARFGEACDLQGDRIIIGSPNAAASRGHATVFRRSGDTWLVEQTLTPAFIGNTRFGLAVAIDGEFAFLGSQLNRIAVFNRTGTTWTEIEPILGPNFSAFGASFDADDGTLIVGAPNESDQEGRAHLYRLFNAQWLFEQTLSHPTPAFGDLFGTAVGISRGRAIVHTPFEDDLDNTFGALLVYQRGPLNWGLVKRIEQQNTDSSNTRIAVAIAGTSILMSDRVVDPLFGGAPLRPFLAIDLDAPAITRQPQDQIVQVGDKVALVIQTTAQHAAFQWRKNGTPISNGSGIVGATTNFLAIDPVDSTHTGIYDCIVSSTVGCMPVVSNPAFISVSSAPPACPGDANDNGVVSFSDITFVLQNWNIACP